MTRKRIPPEVRAHLERAAAGASPLAELLAAWAKFPAAELADAIAQTPLELDSIIGSDAIDGQSRLAALEPTRDPRHSAAFTRWLAAPPWHATGAQPFYRALLERLDEIADPRAIAELTRAKKAADRAIKGLSMRAWLTERIGRVRDALRVRYRDGVPVLPAAEATLARRAGKLAAAEPAQSRTTGGRTAERLLAEIRANPHDDAPRQVYADLLVARGDPHGTFIHLQLARRGRMPEGKEKGRELALLTKHARAWVGDLIGAIGKLSRYRLRVGPDRAGGYLRFDRGFLIGCGLYEKPARVIAAGASPWLATVEELGIDLSSAALLASPQLRALRALRIEPATVEVAADSPVAPQLEAITMYAQLDELWRPLTAMARLPVLRELEIRISDELEAENFAARTRDTLDQAMALPALRRIALPDTLAGDVELVREGDTWTAANPITRTLFPRWSR